MGEPTRHVQITIALPANLLAPFLRAERQFIEFRPSLPPARKILVKDRDEALAVRRLEQVRHFVDDDVFEEVLGLLHKLRVEADVAGAMVAASPLRLHPLEEVAV